MNKKAQIGGMVMFVFMAIIIGASWFAFIGEYFTSLGVVALESGASGGWAFFMTHLNLFFWIVFFLFCLVGINFSGDR